MYRLVRRLGQVVVACLLAAGVGAFVLFGALPEFTSLESRTILTGSMHPAIPAGSLVIVETSSTADPQVGDIVLFRSAEVQSDVVHRIVDIDMVGGEPVFTTQGDANSDPDRSPLVAADILGEIRWSIPGLGHITGAVQGNRSAALLLAVPAILIILGELPVWYRFVRYGREAFEPVSMDQAGETSTHPSHEAIHTSPTVAS